MVRPGWVEALQTKGISQGERRVKQVTATLSLFTTPFEGFSGPEVLCKKGHWPTKSFHWLCVPDGLKHCRQRAFNKVNAELSR